MVEKPPRLTISTSLALTFVNLFVLLSYVNHVAQSGIADTNIERVTADLENAISRLTSNETSDLGADVELPEDYKEHKKDMFCSCSGYIQNIQYPALLDIAERNDLIINLEFKAGDYLFEGERIGSIYPANRAHVDIEKEILKSLDIGSARTGSQDLEYSIRHLVEIGLRALSPGINDNYTAITVLDKLSGVLFKVMHRDLPSHVYYSPDDNIRLIGQSVKTSDIIYRAFSQIRNAGKQKPDILVHITTILGKLIINLAPKENLEQINSIKEQIEYIRQHTEEYFKNTREEQLILSTINKYQL
jgi:uncharacterized membrane protein